MNYYIIGVAVLILLTVLLLWYVVLLARKRAATQTGRDSETSTRRSVSTLRWSFASAIAHIEANLASRWRRYRIPWVMLVGESGAGKSTLIESSGIDRAYKVAAGTVQYVGVGWNYFNRGVVLDIAGEYLGGGAGGSEHPWQTLLHLTEKYRPQRPIDSVVVAVSAMDLLAVSRSSTDKLSQQGELIHRRLWQAQSRFGVRFPVYVVVTQCDRIPGFTSFARALPPHLRDGMLGWSNPNDFEAGYQSDWAQKGVSSIVQDISVVQAELLAAGRVVDETDAFVLFPSELGALHQGLRAYMDQLFRPSAYHETFYFRGIYLTGDAGQVAKAEAAMAGASASTSTVLSGSDGRVEPFMPDDAIIREPAFIKDLFEQKVFAEFGLARASREALATRNQTVRVLRWTTLAIGLFWMATLAFAAFQLDSKILAFEQALEVMVKATRQRDSVHARGESLDLNFYKRGTEVLLDKMAPLGDVQLWWFSIPGSWPGVTELHGDIQRVLFKGFQDIVFNLVRKGLNVKVSELTGVKRNEISTELADVGECIPWKDGESAEPPLVTIAIEDLPEFGMLRDQVASMAVLESNLAIFTRLRNGEAEISDLRALLRYTWKIELPDSLDKGGYQIAAMRQGYPFTTKAPGDVLRAAAACAVRQNVDRINARFFAQNPVLGLSLEVAAKISSLSAAAGRTDGEDEPYADILKQIDALDALLKNPRARWLVGGERDLGPAYVEMWRLVSTVSALGSSVVERSRTDTQSEIDKLDKNISAASSEAVGPIVVRGADGAMALSPDVTSFQSALALLLKQRFMVEGENRKLEVRVDPRTTVRWDAKRLDDAIAMSEEQRRFLKDNLTKFPNALQDEIRAIADRHLGRRMTDLVAKAELLTPELPRARTGGNDTAAETNDFDKSGAQLVRLLTLFKEIGANATYDDLTSLLRRDAVRGLVAINRILDGSELYSVRDGNFLWWQGARNPGLGAFRVADVQALADLLGQQYGQAESLAALSAPLLAVVDNAGIRLDTATTQSVRRLRGLFREVDRFKNKNPRSSVAELEAFIRTELAEVDGQNCIEKMSPKMGVARDSDYFQERQFALRQQLFSRCVELATIEARRAYAAIDRGFDPLRGRFPFGAVSVRGPGGEADPEDVVQFLKLYERYSKAVLPLLGGRAAGLGPLPAPSANDRGSAAGFMDQMSRVRVFLGPLLPPEEAAGPLGYDLSVEFRVNQGVEVDGNKIVDWHLEVGEQALKLRDPPRTIRWRPGMPIALTLRWAKDAPTAPVNDGTVANMSVDGKNVTYRFTGDWALVSLLKSQAASSDAPTRAEVRPHLLKFEFATQAVSTGGQFRSVAPEGRSRVFMRVTVTPGGKKDVLSLPVFPTAVPGLTPEPAASQSPDVPVPSARLGWPDAFGGMVPGTRPGWPDAYGGVFSVRRPPAKSALKAATVKSP